MFNPQDKKSRIDKIESALYSRNSKIGEEKPRHDLRDPVEEVPTDWAEDNEEVRRIKLPFQKILLFSLIFFVLASGLAVYKIFFGKNMVSGDNIDIVMSGPVSVSGGEEISLELQIKNKNSIDLKMVDLHVEYPEGTRQAENITKELRRYDELLGDMKAGNVKNKIVKAVLFGEENSRKDIKVTVEYRMPNSNAIFFREKTFPILISSSPVNITIKNTSEVNANQPTTFEIEIVSNSNTIISNLIMKAEYPFGFDYKSAIPKPAVDTNIWEIGDLAPGAKRTVKIDGVVRGQDEEERVFKFTVGTKDENDDRSISTPFVYATPSITIKKPFVGLALALNGDLSSEYVSESGSNIRADISWQNNLATQIYDVVVEIKLRGTMLNKNSVIAEDGFYRSSDNTIIFNYADNDALLVLSPGDRGEATFNFASFSSFTKTGSSYSNPEIYIDVAVKGKRAEGGSVPEELLYSDSKRVKVASDVSLLSRGFYYVGPFANFGPIPPKAESDTSYTITWAVSNPLNDISSTKVVAKLPAYVKWLGNISPGTENITFNQFGGEIVWNIGNVRAGTGSSLPVKEVSFQVSISPSLSQVGTAPVIVGQAVLTAVDNFTNTEVTDVRPAITTEIQNDPGIGSEDGSVVQ